MAYYVYFMILAAFALPWLMIPRTATLEQRAAETFASNLLVQQQAAIAYARANPSANGAVPTPQLALPMAVTQAGPWVSVLDNSGTGRVATYAPLPVRSTTAGRVAAELARITGGSFGAGLASGGFVASARGSVVALPNGVPDGVPVIVSSRGS